MLMSNKNVWIAFWMLATASLQWQMENWSNFWQHNVEKARSPTPSLIVKRLEPTHVKLYRWMHFAPPLTSFHPPQVIRRGIRFQFKLSLSNLGLPSATVWTANDTMFRRKWMAFVSAQHSVVAKTPDSQSGNLGSIPGASAGQPSRSSLRG